MAAGLALAAGVSGCDRDGEGQPPDKIGQPDPARGAGSGGARELVFSFSGLLTAEIEERTRKSLTVSLLDPIKVQITDEHTAQLLVRLSDYVWPHEFVKPGNGGPLTFPRMHHRLPQIVRIGKETYGMWGLKDTLLWMGEAKKTAGEVAPAAQTSFAFAKLGADVTKEPASPAGWAGREWFVTRQDMCDTYTRLTGKPCPPYQPVKYPVATSQFDLTRGTARGLMPAIDCEYKRDYKLGDINGTRRKFASEFEVAYPASADTTDICLSPIDPSNGAAVEPGGLVIRLRTDAGRSAPVSIINTPVALWSHDHFIAYSALMRLPTPVCLFAYEWCEPPKMPANLRTLLDRRHAAEHDALKKVLAQQGGILLDPCKVSTTGAPNPPDGGCVPFFIEVP